MRESPSFTPVPLLNRRDAVRMGLGVLSCHLLAACGSDAASSPTALEFADDAATVRGDVVEIDIDRVPQWRAAPTRESAVVFLAAQVIVIRVTAQTFRALWSVCPHAGCGVSLVRAGELVCPCHSSTFTFAGERISGPAPTGLSPLAVEFDAVARRLRVKRLSGAS